MERRSSNRPWSSLSAPSSTQESGEEFELAAGSDVVDTADDNDWEEF